MNTALRFPWKTLDELIKMELVVREPSSVHIDSDTLVAVLEPAWTMLVVEMRTGPLVDTLGPLAAEPQVVIEFHAPDAKLRRSVPAAVQGDGTFLADAAFHREELTGRLEITALAVDSGALGRYLGRSSTWTVWLDERPVFKGDSTKGPFPIRWVDFGAPLEAGVSPATAERVAANPQAVWFVDVADAAGSATLLLNSGASGFHRLMNSTKAGTVGALRELIGAQVAAEVTRDLAVRALAELMIEDDEVREPADPLLATMLQDLLNRLEIADGDRDLFLRRAVAAFERGGADMARLVGEVSVVVGSGIGMAKSIDRAWQVIGDQ